MYTHNDKKRVNNYVSFRFSSRKMFRIITVTWSISIVIAIQCVTATNTTAIHKESALEFKKISVHYCSITITKQESVNA